ncbi:MAG: thioredoxin family protein [Candidatus Eisenbacteria bacterium]
MQTLRLAVLALALSASAAVATPVASKHSGSPLPWIVDDYPAALAKARRLGRTLVVEAWAPWCHTCRSMRAFVYTDPSLRRHAQQFVYLDLDTEKARNAGFRQKHKVEAYPTLFFIDPVKERITKRWLGGLTVSQLHVLLDDVAGGGDTPPSLLVQLSNADSLSGLAHNAEAAIAYERVLASASPTWHGYPRTVEALLYAYSVTDQYASGARLAIQALGRVGRSPSGLNIAASGLDCAMNAADSIPQKAAWTKALEAEALSLVRDRSFRTAADDRSGAYITLLGAREAAKDSVGRRQVANEWATFLEGEAAAARTADQRAVFDPHRLSAYLELGEPERAVGMLQQSEKDFPADYNPPQRLATAYKAMKHWDEALAASDRAMAKGYGPRKLLLYQTRADILTGRQDKAGARAVLTEALAFAEALPAGQRSENAIQGLRRKLSALGE